MAGHNLMLAIARAGGLSEIQRNINTGQNWALIS